MARRGRPQRRTVTDYYYEEAADALGPPDPAMVSARGFKRPPVKAFLLVFAILVLFVVVRDRQPVAITTSCTTPSFAMSKSVARLGSPVRYSITGPAGEYVLAVDVASITVKPGGILTPVPATGVPASATQAASQPVTLKNCLFHGSFAVVVPKGEHTVTLFRIERQTAVSVFHLPLTVNPS